MPYLSAYGTVAPQSIGARPALNFYSKRACGEVGDREVFDEGELVESGGDVKILDDFSRDLGFFGWEVREAEAEDQDRKCRGADPT